MSAAIFCFFVPGKSQNHLWTRWGLSFILMLDTHFLGTCLAPWVDEDSFVAGLVVKPLQAPQE